MKAETVICKACGDSISKQYVDTGRKTFCSKCNENTIHHKFHCSICGNVEEEE